MFRRMLILASLLLVSTLPVSAQAILPAQFSGWSSANVETMQPADLEKLAADSAPILREDGAILVERRTYTRGANELTTVLYRMNDPTGAYAAYSFLRTPDMTGPKLTDHSSFSSDKGLILIGNFVLSVSSKELPALRKDLSALAQTIETHADDPIYPVTWEYLPDQGRILRSDRYIIGPVALNQLLPLSTGDWLGFQLGAEAEFARYKVEGKEISLLVVEYPTPQIATKEMQELGRIFRLNPRQSTDAESSSPSEVLFARQSSSLVAIVAGAKAQETANALLLNVQYQQNLTWNEPGYSYVAQGLPLIIARIIIATGVLCMFALIAGVAFGGIRILVKHFLPGRVFDRESAVGILQLGLTSKPIEAEDLYQ